MRREDKRERTEWRGQGVRRVILGLFVGAALGGCQLGTAATGPIDREDTMEDSALPSRSSAESPRDSIKESLSSSASSSDESWRLARGFAQSAAGDAVRVRTLAGGDDVIELEYALPRPVLNPESDGYAIHVGDAPSSERPGLPVVPVIPMRMGLPPGKALADLQVTPLEWTDIPGSHPLIHGRDPGPVDAPSPRTSKDRAIYDSDRVYPEVCYEADKLHVRRGIQYQVIRFYPIAYKPHSGKLSFCPRVRVRLLLEPTQGMALPAFPNARDARFVDNPHVFDAMPRVALRAKTPPALVLGSSLCNPADQHTYVIITSPAFKADTAKNSLKDLLAHRTSLGLTGTIVTTDEIYANYPGEDQPEKIRNFIRDAHANWGTEYVLLAGDQNVVAARYVRESPTGVPSNQKVLFTDLYYSCLDGSYLKDPDGLWYQSEADRDFDPEVYVGRASAENLEEIHNFVYKTLTYEKSPIDASYHTKLLNWREPVSGIGDTSEWRKIFTKDDSENTGEYVSSTDLALLLRRLNSHNLGYHLVASHGTPVSLGVLGRDQTPKLTNNDQFFFLDSIACLAGRIDGDTLSERLTTSYQNGAFAAMLNSEIGYGQISRVMSDIRTLYFDSGVTTLGAMAAEGKRRTIDATGASNIFRYSVFEHNLFGDPAATLKGIFATSFDGYYPMDEQAGTTTSDRSGNRGDCKLVNGAAWGKGKYQGGIETDGDDDVVECAHSDWAPHGMQSELTVMAWIKSSAFKEGGTVIAKGGTAKPFALGITSKGNVQFSANTGSPAGAVGSGTWVSNGALTVGDWHHVAVTYDYDEKKLRFYIDGQQDSSVDVQLFFGSSSDPLRIGDGFKGSIDEVRLYGRDLPRADVVAAMHLDLVARYDLDEETGTAINDGSPFQNAATLENGPAFTTGHRGRGLSFDGVDDVATCPDSPSLDIRRRLTLAAWINPRDFGDSAGIITKGSSTSPYALELTGDGALRFIANQGYSAGAQHYVGSGAWTSSQRLSRNAWQHVACMFNGDAVTFYVNGKRDKSERVQLVFGESDGPLTMGRNASGGSHFKGALDDVRVYARALSPDEIKTLAAAEADGIAVGDGEATDNTAPGSDDPRGEEVVSSHSEGCGHAGGQGATSALLLLFLAFVAASRVARAGKGAFFSARKADDFRLIPHQD